MTEFNYTFFDTPLGTVFVASKCHRICRLTFGMASEEAFAEHLQDKFGLVPQRDDALVAPLKRDFRYYLRGATLTWDYEIDISSMTEFQRSVLETVRRIPHGLTKTYGEIAAILGKSGHAARAVGQAVGANPVPIIIPCHRVVASDGTLGGFGLGLDLKQQLLDIEQLDTYE